MTAQSPLVGTAISSLSNAETISPDQLRPDALCPNCGEGKLDYNGLLDLECIHCGYVISGGAGCT